MDSEASTSVTAAEEKVTEIAPRRMTKMEAKRMAAYEERRRRLINKGTHPDKVDEVIQQEEYAELPLEEKFQRFQTLTTHALREFQNDISALRHNDGMIAEAMDINLKAVSMALVKAGVTLEVQGVIIKEVEIEIRAEQAAKDKARLDKIEKVRLEQEVAAVPSLGTESAPGADLPEGATVFGDS